MLKRKLNKWWNISKCTIQNGHSMLSCFYLVNEPLEQLVIPLILYFKWRESHNNKNVEKMKIVFIADTQFYLIRKNIFKFIIYQAYLLCTHFDKYFYSHWWYILNVTTLLLFKMIFLIRYNIIFLIQTVPNSRLTFYSQYATNRKALLNDPPNLETSLLYQFVFCVIILFFIFIGLGHGLYILKWIDNFYICTSDSNTCFYHRL